MADTESKKNKKNSEDYYWVTERVKKLKLQTWPVMGVSPQAAR